MEALTLLDICDRFHCVPSVALEEDANIIRLLRVEALGRPRREENGGETY